jgi:D-glucuronyl C5-epimerase C-terminus
VRERSIPAMRPKHIPAHVLVVSLALLVAPPSALAGRVLLLDPSGHERAVDERGVSNTDLPGPPGGVRAARAARARAAVRSGATRTTLRSLLSSRQIDQVEYQNRLGVYNAAVSQRNRLSGKRRNELGWVIENTDEMAQRGALTAARLEPVFLILSKNTEFWRKYPIPAAGDRVQFYGSQLIFQYYPGEGMQLQQNATWGKVNAAVNDKAKKLAIYRLDEIVPLAVNRDGGVAWEYFFHFGGGSPPWTSSLSQGSAVQALIHASAFLRNRSYAGLAYRSLRLFQLRPPRGIRTPRGPGRVHYVIYSFAPHYYVLNAFIQALNGLFDMGSPKLGKSAKARTLFAAGDREARRELPLFDTGHWARYSLSGEISDTSYMTLLRDFLRDLCQRVGPSPYCTYATRFTRYLNG